GATPFAPAEVVPPTVVAALTPCVSGLLLVFAVSPPGDELGPGVALTPFVVLVAVTVLGSSVFGAPVVPESCGCVAPAPSVPAPSAPIVAVNTRCDGWRGVPAVVSVENQPMPPEYASATGACVCCWLAESLAAVAGVDAGTAGVAIGVGVAGNASG